MIGVYYIKNLKNNKIYIGQSLDVKRRLISHKRTLMGNIHKNKELQNSFNKNGIEVFEFGTLEECDREKLTERETYWCNFYGGYKSDNTYNEREPGPRGNQSEETKAKISAKNKGHAVSKETRDKISEKLTGTALSDETKEKLKGRIPWNKGGHVSREAVEKQRLKMLGRTVDRGNHVAQYTKDGILISTYKSYAEAERVTSVSNTGIRSCCKGERKTAGGYIWVKIDQHG